MADLPSNEDADNLPSPTDLIDGQFSVNSNQSSNGTSTSIDSLFKISSETLRVFYLAIAIIIVLICLTLCIYICLRRYVFVLHIFDDSIH